MSHPVGAKEYPNNIFKQTTPDEEQALTDQPRFQTWYKGWLTRSEIYERRLPDGLTSALRIDGPGDSAFSLDNKGNIRILTGKKTEVAGSGVLGIKTWGQQQLHNERSNLQYCAGGTENEGQALNVLCYGDYVEESVGSTRYIKAAKIEITATEELVLNGQTVKIQAQGDIEMAAASVTTAQVNKKDIILGQKMTFGAGEDTDLQFDPRASRNVVSPGNIHHTIAGDYKVKSLRTTTVNGVAGLFMSSPASTTVQGLAGMIINGPGGLNIAAAKTSIETADLDLVAAKTDITTADLDIDAAKVDLTGSADVSITGANVRLTGALIYLN
tara:strand:+ start:2939 stop:3922 length:984 start_codon:yes stop_codon:yes gene_type:complete